MSANLLLGLILVVAFGLQSFRNLLQRFVDEEGEPPPPSKRRKYVVALAVGASDLRIAQLFYFTRDGRSIVVIVVDETSQLMRLGGQVFDSEQEPKTESRPL